MRIAEDKLWGTAWVAMTVALALHVVDEAATGFLPFYNAAILALRESNPWVPLPTFTFSGWLGGLILGILVLLGLAPLAFKRKTWLRPLAYFLGLLMTANALGHIAISAYLGQPAPGVYSSPVLLVASIALLFATRQDARAGAGRGT